MAARLADVAVGLVAGVALVTLFVADYGQGRTVYSALASYHAYLELPLILAMLLGFDSRSRAATE